MSTGRGKRVRTELAERGDGISDRLQNSSTAAAVGIRIDNITNGNKVLRCFPKESLAPGSADSVQCQIGAGGRNEKDNVGALLDDEILLRIIGISSDTLPIRIVYSNLESAALRKTWALQYSFWSDFAQNRPFLSTPALEVI